MEDIVLINAYKEWDSSCFWEIYKKYIGDIYRFVYRKVGNVQVSEDITSSIWIKILNSIHTYEEQSGASFKSWIYRIAHNSVIDYFRTKKEDINIEEITEPWWNLDFWKEIDDKDTLVRVKKYLWELSEREREIVFFRVWDDMSYREISEILCISVDNCKQICSRTIKKIQANISLVLLFLLFIL